MDETATNFDSKAKKDNASCYYEGCTDSTATNYWGVADTDDGSCTYESQEFVGIYLAEDSIQGGILPFEYSYREYDFEIEQHPDFPEQLVITNYANIFSVSAEQQTVAEVSDDEFSLNEQNPTSTDQNLEDYTIMSGHATLTGEQLVFKYEFQNSFGEVFAGAGTAMRVQPVE